MSSLLCLTSDSSSNIVSVNGSNYYTFNNETTYDEDRRYGLYDGTYTLRDISQSHPMAILNSGISNITYSVVNNSPIIIYVSGGSTTSDANSDYFTFTDSDSNSISIGDGSFRFMRGRTYRFTVGSGGFNSSHEFQVYYSGSLTTLSTTVGEHMDITIPSDHSTTLGDLYYRCGIDSHSGMTANMRLLYEEVNETGETTASYDFYYGDISVNVTGDFTQVSVYCYYHNYMGVQNLFQYSTTCNESSNESSNETTNETTNDTTNNTTSSYNKSLYCLTQSSTSNIVNNNYTFNGETTYNTLRTYGLYDGTYTLTDISQSHPFAILNNDVSNSITYTPNNTTPITIYVYSPLEGGYNDGYYKFATSTGEIDISNDFLFMRNKTYIFEASGEFASYPFRIYHNNSYTSDISQNGDQLTFTIQSDQDTNIYYQCHHDDYLEMSGNLTLSTKTLTGTTSDGTYDFYYGDVDVTVTSDFNQVSVYCYYHNYMGGQNLFRYSSKCNLNGTKFTCYVPSFINNTLDICGDFTMLNGHSQLADVSMDNLDVNGTLTINEPVNENDAANKKYVDDLSSNVFGIIDALDVENVTKLDISTNLTVLGHCSLQDTSVNHLDVSSDLHVFGNFNITYKEKEEFLFDTIVIRRPTGYSPNGNWMNLRELQMWVDNSNVLPTNAGSGYNSFFAPTNISYNDISNQTTFMDWSTKAPSATYTSEKIASNIYNNIFESNFGVSGSDAGNNTAFYVPLTTQYNINSIQSIVLYYSTIRDKSHSIGLAIELYNRANDPNLSNVLSYSDEISTIADVFRFDYSEIDNYTKGFVSVDSSTNIVSSSYATSYATTQVIESTYITKNLNLGKHSQLVDVSCQHLDVSGDMTINGHSQLVDVSCQHLDVTGNTTIGGTLAVTGDTTIGGTLNANGGITGDNFVVADTTGNTSIGGTLNVTGNTTLTGTLNANGGITGDNFEVADTTGNTSIGGTLNVTGNTTLTGTLNANGGITGDNFEVADSTGNTSIGGTLDVTGGVGIGTSTSDTTQTGIDNNLYKGQSGNQQTFEGKLAVFGQVIFRDTGETSTSGATNRGGPLLFGNGYTGGFHHMDMFNHNLFYINYYSGIQVNVPTLSQSSDDRVKKDEMDISNATIILLKLNPQKYKKYNDMSCSGDYIIETGLISQEVYYEVPELRHIVSIDNIDSSGNNILPTELTQEEHKNIKNDLSYNELNWGEKSCSIKYNNLIAYLIKGFQEQQEIIEEEKTKVSTLETQYNTLQSQYNDLLSRVSALENST